MACIVLPTGQTVMEGTGGGGGGGTVCTGGGGGGGGGQCALEYNYPSLERFLLEPAIEHW